MFSKLSELLLFEGMIDLLDMVNFKFVNFNFPDPTGYTSNFVTYKIHMEFIYITYEKKSFPRMQRNRMNFT